jgi:hypothetical protein
MSEWRFWGTLDSIQDYEGFIYKITNNQTNKFYIGKKNFFSKQNKPLTKTELAEQTDKRKSKKKLVIKESNWRTYWGSNKELLKDVKELGEDQFDRQILTLCKTKKSLTYWEMHHQCKHECIVSPQFSYNDNILGKFFPKDVA